MPYKHSRVRTNQVYHPPKVLVKCGQVGGGETAQSICLLEHPEPGTQRDGEEGGGSRRRRRRRR